jgi:transcription termination/antitermination protein NusG
MSHPIDETREPFLPADDQGDGGESSPTPPEGTGAPGPTEVEEQTPDGCRLSAGPASPPPAAEAPGPEPEPESEPAAEVPEPEPEPEPAPKTARPARPARPAPAARAPEPAVAAEPLLLDDDDEPAPVLVWYVLKVQSSREDTIRDALERRVKIQGLQRYFGRIVVPTEKITEIRNNKKRTVERKTYPGYIMVEMELNEKTWFTVRETPGVGDFVGAHGTPSKMTETEVNQMLGQETAKTEEAPRVRIDVERGDRVKIKDGPFENFEGTIEEVIEARGLVKVMLIIFNRPTPVDLEYWQVERI